MRKYKAVTLIELILVIALITILAAMASPFASSFILRNNQTTTTNKVISSIQKAQSNSMNQKNFEKWGVCISNGQIIVYGGDQTANCNTNQYEEFFPIPETVSVSGLNDTSFNQYGEPEPVNGLSTITINTQISSSVVNVNQMGGIEKN
jgi:prepilin-type N-terminal cleavage/methylation domain-containing protein